MEKITLYEFNLLSLEQQLQILWDKGTYLDNYVTENERANCYALYMFFVEVYYDPENNKLTHLKTFKTGKGLDRYSTI